MTRLLVRTGKLVVSLIITSSLVEAWSTRGRIFSSYHPEQHYMRGPALDAENNAWVRRPLSLDRGDQGPSMKYGLRDVLKELNSRNFSELSASTAMSFGVSKLSANPGHDSAQRSSHAGRPRGRRPPNRAGDVVTPSAVGWIGMQHSVGTCS
jgi:hypothetical protein